LPKAKNKITEIILYKFSFLAEILNLRLKQYVRLFLYRKRLPIIYLNQFIAYKLIILKLLCILTFPKSFLNNPKYFSKNIFNELLSLAAIFKPQSKH
jgi:hypothetical protein